MLAHTQPITFWVSVPVLSLSTYWTCARLGEWVVASGVSTKEGRANKQQT
jgi:hypothetical protein